MKNWRWSSLVMLILVILLGTIKGAPRKIAASQENVCTPVGTWNWMGGLTVVIHSDGSQEGFANGNRAYTGRWESLGGGGYRLTWRENGSVDTLRLSPDGRSMDGSNSAGTSIHVTCRAGSQPPPTGNVCTPVGSWNWMGGLTVVIHSDGSQEGFANGNRAYTGRWESLGGGGYRLTWRENGSVDTLRLSPDGRSMDGSNSAGTSIHVTCQAGSQPPPPPPPPTQGDIGLNGCWNQCAIHIFQEGENLFYSAIWVNPPNTPPVGLIVQKGIGWVRGRDIYLHDVIGPSSLLRGGPQHKSEYYLKLSEDGNLITGYYVIDGQKGLNVGWSRDYK